MPVKTLGHNPNHPVRTDIFIQLVKNWKKKKLHNKITQLIKLNNKLINIISYYITNNS